MVQAAIGACSVSSLKCFAQQGLHIATNIYPWLKFYEREGKDFNADLDAGLGQIASAGLNGFESIINGPGDIDMLKPLLKKHGLEMRSLYVNSTLHESAKADASIDLIIAIAGKAKQVGTKIIVTNPSPIRWGGPENKDDSQLIVQANAMNKLGKALNERGLVLSYHNHDMEMRNSAREFHHMMVGTDPKVVTLCLDAHWIYRGSGNSAVAMYDILKLYGKRITELHLRQSVDGIWAETFSGKGDIDYSRIAAYLKRLNIRPHITIEQAVEAKSPKTMNATEAHRISAVNARKVFAGF